MSKVDSISIDELIEQLTSSKYEGWEAQVRRAHTFADAVHNGRIRATGQASIDHDLAVAHLMIQLKAHPQSIVAAMLHDILLVHPNITSNDIEKHFGPSIATMVTSLVALNSYEAQLEREIIQEKAGTPPPTDTAPLPPPDSETVRENVISIIENDIRVILIRMVDCLEDLRWAAQLPTERQIRLAREAMDIYAPLANRLGVWQLKWELEDLAFRYLEPERYKFIANQLAAKRDERTRKVEQAVEQLKETITEAGIESEVYGRSKHIYSIHRKMVRKNLNLDGIYDIEALRVILKPDEAEYENKTNKAIEDAERSLCYQVLGLVHSLWQPIPREFDDYIAAPKANGYKSLHTAVVDPQTRQRLEVQIRTQRMHDEAEKGVAAHWAYKEENSRVKQSTQRRIHGLREMLNILQDTDGEPDVLESDFLVDRIYVFTPKGQLVDLPAKATPIDFAYQIHTKLGHRTRGARVNGKMVSLDHQLKAGNRVEILTTKKESPSRDWMNPSLGYCVSARTRSKIRQWFRTQEKDQNILQGREVVERELRRLGLQDSATVSDIAAALKFDDEELFLSQVGFGDIQSSQISGAISRLHGQLQHDVELRPLLNPSPPKTKGLTVRGVGGVHTKMGNCCSPIPPEPIIGYITRGQGITIHSQDCHQLQNITEQERLIEVSWGEESERYPIPIVLRAYRRSKLLDDVLNVLRGQQISVPKTKTITKDNIVSIFMVAEVTSLDQLNWLLNKLDNLPHVISAQRQRWT